MKRLALSACLLCGLAAAAQTQPASVGIQTENPQGVLHIDGGATAAQPSDDVVIDASGRLGAGVLAPAAKVDSRASAPGGALRIQDGTQGNEKVLTSDADGAAAWAPQLKMPGSRQWFAFLSTSAEAGNNSRRTNSMHPVVGYSGSYISSAGLGSANPTTGTITVPFTGRYLVTCGGYFLSRVVTRYWGRLILYVAPGGGSTQISRWTPSAWGGWEGSHASAGPFFSNMLELEAGDALSLTFDATLNINAHVSRVRFFNVEFIQE